MDEPVPAAVDVLQGQAAVVDAVLAANQVFVAVATNALVGIDPEVTLPQFRTLVLLDQYGSMTMTQLADALGVVRSTATRMCDRLVAKRLIRRAVDPANRRRVVLRLLAGGRDLIAESTRRRTAAITDLLDTISPADQARLADSLRLLIAAAGP